MRVIIVAFLISITSLMRGCCRDERTEPKLPNSVSNWKDSHEGGVHSLGSFLLRRDEVTERENVAIKLVEIIPSNPCAEADLYNNVPKAKFHFIRASDQRVLCEAIFAENSNTVLGTAYCGPDITELGIGGLSIRAINYKEGWVYFYLSGL